MTTPAACVEVLRGMPSMAFAVSTSSLTRSSESYICRSCGDCFSASASVMCGVDGTSLATASVSA